MKNINFINYETEKCNSASYALENSEINFIEVFNYLKSKIINHMFLSSISSNYNLILRPKKLRLLKEPSEQISNINYFYFTFLCGHEGIK